MARIYLVRHGEASGYDGADPALTDLGHQQAQLVAQRLDQITGAPIDIVSSPLRRARDTAQPLADLWAKEPLVVDAVRELPSPGPQRERRGWLRAALRTTFADLGDEQRAWRDGILHSLTSHDRDTAVFTHAVVISAVVGHVQRDDRVLGFLPANTSITIIDVADGVLKLVQRGEGRDDVGEVG